LTNFGALKCTYIEKLKVKSWHNWPEENSGIENSSRFRVQVNKKNVCSQLACTQSLPSGDGLKACIGNSNITHPIDESKTPC
jgi:hypothetical protein